MENRREDNPEEKNCSCSFCFFIILYSLECGGGDVIFFNMAAPKFVCPTVLVSMVPD